MRLISSDSAALEWSSVHCRTRSSTPGSSSILPPSRTAERSAELRCRNRKGHHRQFARPDLEERRPTGATEPESTGMFQCFTWVAGPRSRSVSSVPRTQRGAAQHSLAAPQENKQWLGEDVLHEGDDRFGAVT